MLARGVEIHLLLCEFVRPDAQRCGDTQRALWVLLGAPGAEGLRVRLARPKHGAFPMLQTETWCADGEAHFSGSFDFHGSHASHGDCLVVTRDPPFVRAREADFRRLWNEAYGQVAEAVLAEHRSRFRRIWYPTDGPLADPGELLDAFGSCGDRAADESSATSSPRDAYCFLCGKAREDYPDRRFCPSEVPVRAAGGSSL